jgi:hypothetical protein
MADERKIKEYRKEVRDYDGKVVAIVTTDDGDVVVENANEHCRRIAVSPEVTRELARVMNEASVWAEKICYRGWRADYES